MTRYDSFEFRIKELEQQNVTDSDQIIIVIYCDEGDDAKLPEVQAMLITRGGRCWVRYVSVESVGKQQEEERQQIEEP